MLGMFADDTILATQHTDLETACQQLQSGADIITRWFAKWCLQINHAKCETKIFTLRKIQDPPKISISDTEISWNPCDGAVRYLGVYLDTRLTWSYNTNKKINLAYARFVQLYPLLNRNSPMRIECCKLLYTTLIRPLMTYACPVWYNMSTTNKKKIQTVQNKVLRVTVNAPWFVRNAQIHSEVGITTIEEFMRKLTAKFFSNLTLCDSAVSFNLGNRNVHTRLKRKLPQDLL